MVSACVFVGVEWQTRVAIVSTIAIPTQESTINHSTPTRDPTTHQVRNQPQLTPHASRTAQRPTRTHPTPPNNVTQNRRTHGGAPLNIWSLRPRAMVSTTLMQHGYTTTLHHPVMCIPTHAMLAKMGRRV